MTRISLIIVFFNNVVQNISDINLEKINLAGISVKTSNKFEIDNYPNGNIISLLNKFKEVKFLKFVEFAIAVAPSTPIPLRDKSKEVTRIQCCKFSNNMFEFDRKFNFNVFILCFVLKSLIFLRNSSSVKYFFESLLLTHEAILMNEFQNLFDVF